MKCSHCGRLNHSEENCFILHPEKRPASEKEKALEAKIAALEAKFKTVASLGQVTGSGVSPSARAHTFGSDVYMFGASGEMAAAVATRAQTLANPVVSTTAGPQENMRARHSGLLDHIGQARLPLSFTLADAGSAARPDMPASAHDDTIVARDLAHTLAHKVLQMPIFSGLDMMTPDC